MPIYKFKFTFAKKLIVMQIIIIILINQRSNLIIVAFNYY